MGSVGDSRNRRSTGRLRIRRRNVDEFLPNRSAIELFADESGTKLTVEEKERQRQRDGETETGRQRWIKWSLRSRREAIRMAETAIRVK